MTKSDQTIAIGVGAVVFKDNDVLLIRRGKPPFEGKWSIPGGRLEYNERVVDAVTREVREETNIEIEIITLLDVYDARPNDTGAESQSHMVIIDYVAEWRAGQPIAGDDAIDATFVNFDVAMERMSWDETRQALVKARKIRDEARLRMDAIKRL